MTPRQLLDDVKLRFHTLLHCEEDALEVLLKQALGAYQDNAGASETILINAVENLNGIRSFLVPDDFLARVVVKDKTGNYVPSHYDRSKTSIVINTARFRLPLSFQYFLKLREADLESYQLPPSIVGLIQDYLEILIAIPNSERRRRVALAGNLDTSDIPTESDLITRKGIMEERMKSARSALPMISIQP